MDGEPPSAPPAAKRAKRADAAHQRKAMAFMPRAVTAKQNATMATPVAPKTNDQFRQLLGDGSSVDKSG